MAEDGKEVPGQYGYKYFGAARDMPGVRELFEKPPEAPPRKTRGELMKNVDAEYFGYRDEEDGVIVPLEQEEEKKVAEQMMKEWQVNFIVFQLETQFSQPSCSILSRSLFIVLL